MNGALHAIGRSLALVCLLLAFGAVPGVAGRAGGLRDAARKHRAEQITSTFENSTTALQYAYAENLHDGRGITAGRAGFCSGTGDLLLVVSLYARLAPGNALARYLPALRAVDGTASTAGLAGFAGAWAHAARADHLLRRAQDRIEDRFYFDPAMRYAARYRVATALGQAVLWDTIIQHGDGGDPDGIARILRETAAAMGGRVNGDEPAWIMRFLALRRHHLLHAADPSTRAAWRESVDRVNALASLARAGGWKLDPPLAWSVYGDRFTLR